MKHALAWVLIIAVGAGCSGEAPPAETEPEAIPAGNQPKAPENVMEDIEMHLWPPAEVRGEDMKPLLTIRAGRVTGMGGETAELAFENAEAVVPAREADDLAIHFQAARGRYVEDKKAVLEGGVTAQIDDMTISLEEITWEIVAAAGEEGAGGIASSDSPLKITSPTQRLEASSLRLNPDAKILELRDVAGEITFSGEEL